MIQNIILSKNEKEGVDYVLHEENPKMNVQLIDSDFRASLALA